ncbi:MAG: MipA/OmpV family protein [Pseudomonadota bacterium]
MKRHLLAVLALSGSFFALPALAEDSATLATSRASQRSNEQAEQVIGASLGYGTRLFTSTDWQANLFAEANFANGVFLSSTDGLGYRFLNSHSGFSAAASISASGWRKSSFGKSNSHNRLIGMPDIDPEAQANLFLNYDDGAFHINTGVHQTLGARRDASIDVTGRYDLLSTKTDLVELSGGFRYANKNEMNTYFGVTKAQSLSSGNAEYAAKSGIAGAGVGVNWRHAINQNWVTTVGANAIRLGDVAADSSLTDRRTVSSVNTSIAYRF